jgi:hypothetical protein
MGEIIRHSGIPTHDTLSYTASGFPLIDHEWLHDLSSFICISDMAVLSPSPLFLRHYGH